MKLHGTVRSVAWVLALGAAGCAGERPRPASVASAPVAVATVADAAAPQAREARVVTLVTYEGSGVLGRERSRDDGTVLTSEIALGGQAFTVVIDRAARRVRVVHGGESVEREVPDGTLALENGHWQAYAIAAERYADAATPQPFTLLLPARDVRVPATILVRPGEQGARQVEVRAAGLVVTVDVSAEGVVTHGTVPVQRLEARLEGEPGPVPEAARGAPAGVTEEAWDVTRGDVAIRGVLWLPASATGPVPVVVLVAGSGPTDRDGNSALGLRTDTYRMLAEALAARGVATVRFDKRGVGQSGHNFDAAALTLTDFVDDAAAVVARVRSDARFSAVTVAGHSEGGLIALQVAQHAPVDGLVLIATPGRPLGAVLREQLARQFDAATMTEVDRILAALRAGQPLGDVPAPLQSLFRPNVVAFLRSVLDVDPVAALRGLQTPTAVVQGETDVQVTPVDARALAASRRGVRLTLLPRTNHVLKVELAATQPQSSYSDPSLPLAPGVVDAVLAGVARPHAPRAPRAAH